jgi:FlaA1/EpsC-like NDP-sugar epimerase
MSASNDKNIKTLIVGAGKAGELISADIMASSDVPFAIVGFVDDDPAKHGTEVNGVRVYGAIDDLQNIVDETGATEVIIALPSRRGEAVRRVIQSAEGRHIVFRILPRLSEVLAQDYDEDYLKYIRKVEAVDLVGGQIPKTDQEDLRKNLSKEVVLVTGAAGSIGSELSRQVSLYQAKKVIFYDWWENGMFHLRNQIIESYPDGDFEFIIGDVKDKTKINLVMKKYKPTTVFHAAAYKHVPLMESNAAEAVKGNIIGTKTVAESAVRHGVHKFILVSTDKAVNPTNVMGTTKRAAEMIIHILAESQSTTKFCAVRFGNVANSNGSVIPFFERQLEKGGPLTVTHRDITRFFMTIPEAVHLILKAWIMGENNDLFVLDMGESIKIYDLAKWLIILNGYVPEEDIKIVISGLRPAEKLYEEVLVKEEETLSTPVHNVFRTKNYLDFDRLAFLNNLAFLVDALSEDQLNSVEIKRRLKGMVSTYHPQGMDEQ